MERQELENQIIEMVSTSYNKDVADLSLTTSFKEDLSGASIQMVGLVAEIENELDIMIPLQVASTCETIGDLVDKVQELE